MSHQLSRHWRGLLFVIWALVHGTCQAQPTQAVELAQRFVRHLAAADVTQLQALESPQLRAALPATKLSVIWQSLQRRYGTFSSCDVTANTPLEAGASVMMDCAFRTHIVPLRLTVIDAAVAGVFLHEPRAIAPVAASGERHLRFGRPGWLLPATLTMPSSGAPLASVVLLHGSGPQDRDGRVGETAILRDLAAQLAQENIATFRFEKRTKQHGLRLAAQEQVTLDEEVIDDALSAVSTMAEQPGMAGTCTILIGHSQGAFLAPYIYRLKKERRIDALVLLAPPGRPLGKVVLDQIDFLIAEPGTDEGAAAVLRIERRKLEQLLAARDIGSIPATALPRTMGAPVWRFFYSYDAIAEWRKSRPPTLALFAEKDYQVPRADWLAWADTARTEQALRVEMIADASHVFTPVEGAPSPKIYATNATVLPIVGRKIAEFARQHCAPIRATSPAPPVPHGS